MDSDRTWSGTQITFLTTKSRDLRYFSEDFKILRT